jgi:hypothetical protein
MGGNGKSYNDTLLNWISSSIDLESGCGFDTG